jgi:hypothetical protein
MTSQLTPERTTSLPAKTVEAPESTTSRPAKANEARELPLFLQPWFLMAVLSMVGIVLVILLG